MHRAIDNYKRIKNGTATPRHRELSKHLSTSIQCSIATTTTTAIPRLHATTTATTTTMARHYIIRWQPSPPWRRSLQLETRATIATIAPPVSMCYSSTHSMCSSSRRLNYQLTSGLTVRVRDRIDAQPSSRRRMVFDERNGGCTH